MKINIIEDGPIVLDTNAEVSVQVAGHAPGEPTSGPLFLCRCGQSSNKPFCDGTHRKVKFEGISAELKLD